MSWDVDLCDPVTNEVLELDNPHFMRGGTYAVGGTCEMSLNITFNYTRFYNDAFKGGFRALDGVTAVESIPILKAAIEKIKDPLTPDLSQEEREHYESQQATGYWMPTKDNCLRPLYQLLSLAQMRPDGVWRVE